MTNLERVKEEMRIEDVANFGGLPCNIIHKIKNEVNCADRSCKECELWLADEYVEHIFVQWEDDEPYEIAKLLEG